MSVTQGNNGKELWAEFQALLEEELEAKAESTRRRKELRALGSQLLELGGRSFAGVRNLWYYGPDVDNNKNIFLIGSQANLPFDQMTRDGKRSSLRRPRVKRKA